MCYIKSPDWEKIIYRSVEPIILIDQPWEEKLELPALFVVDVLPDEENKRLIMYYLVRDIKKYKNNCLCIAFSENGLDWEKPKFNNNTNIIMNNSWCSNAKGEFIVFSVMKDKQETDLSRRWKMLYYDWPNCKHSDGLCLAVSGDGIKWYPIFDKPAIMAGNDAASLIDFPIKYQNKGRWNGNYHIYQQTIKFDATLPKARENLKFMRRCISLWVSEKFSDVWIGPISLLEPDNQDPKDLQFYWMTPFHVLDGFQGFLNCHYTRDQTMDVQLISSKDGWTWERGNNRKSILSVGGKNDFDCNEVYITAKPIKWNNEILVYYNGNAYTHDWLLPRDFTGKHKIGIGLAKFKEA